MKRITTIFLTFAYIMLLAHAVIPHHHHKHQTSVCVMDTHFCHDHDAEHSSNEEDSTESDYDDCLLTSTLVTQINQSVTSPMLEFVVVMYNLDLGCLYSNLGKISFPYIPYLESDYTTTVSCVKGLRAPPIYIS